MPGRNRGKYWSASLLKRRGWTNELIRELLPAPERFLVNGRAVRAWSKVDVRQAEKSTQFAQRKRSKPSEGAGRAQDIEPIRNALELAWERAEKEENAVWILAGHYHSGILSRLPTAAKSRGVRTSQAAAWLGEFLALEQRCEGRHLPEIFKHFLQAGGWLGEHSDHPLTGQVYARYPQVLLAAAKQVLAEFRALQPEADVERFLQAEGFPSAQLLLEGLGAVWSVWYVPKAIRTSLSLLIALNPKDEYPEARAMHRRFVLHLGGTNTGKTYAGFQRLIRAETGVYLAPLRLLALEAQETLLDAGVDCSLSTGEEEDLREEDTHMAATAEKLSLERHYDVAVIDECQMIADPQRGYAWTRAILGVLAPEVHLCAAPEAKHLLIRLIESCGDTYEVQEHQRTTPLICMPHPIDYQRVQPGDALITFSKVGVLSVAEDLRQSGKEPAIIYGNLELIRAGLEAVVPPLQYAVVGFSDLVLQVDFDLLEVLTQWNQMPTVEPYRKLDISRYIAMISKMREMGFVLSKEQELRAANIPFDETEEALRELFFQFLHRWQEGGAIDQPGQPEGDITLPELELYYRKLDLYFSFAKAFGCPVDEDKLYDSRERVADEINEILLHRLRNNIRFCARCGKALPLHHRGRLCDACFQRERGGAVRNRRKK